MANCADPDETPQMSIDAMVVYVYELVVKQELNTA